MSPCLTLLWWSGWRSMGIQQTLSIKQSSCLFLPGCVLPPWSFLSMGCGVLSPWSFLSMGVKCVKHISFSSFDFLLKMFLLKSTTVSHLCPVCVCSVRRSLCQDIHNVIIQDVRLSGEVLPRRRHVVWCILTLFGILCRTVWFKYMVCIV